jgi:hypothetical protein
VIRICGRDIRIRGRVIRVAQIDGEKYTFPEDPEAMVKGLRECGERIDLFTFLQKLPAAKPQYSYPFEMDNLAVIPVSTFENWWNHQILSFPRNRARQAEKRGAVLREVPLGDELFEGIRHVYNETPVRQGKPFPYFGMTLDQAREYACTFPDRSIFIAAFAKDEMIGFVKLVVDETKTQACIVHILSMVKHKDKAPTNALIARSVKTCADRGIPHLVYEHFAYGKKTGDSLSHFKEVNGFRRVDLPRYYIPLTLLGKAGFALGLHRRLVENIPEALASRLREWRKAWHGQRAQKASEV